MHEFWHMGGYGAYVWSSYGLAAAVLAYNVIEPYLRLRRVERRIGRAAGEQR
jgi:heme exporter protein D